VVPSHPQWPGGGRVPLLAATPLPSIFFNKYIFFY
jgi:hypothetical protein